MFGELTKRTTKTETVVERERERRKGIAMFMMRDCVLLAKKNIGIKK
jgi:hypothetical protein